MSIMRSMTLLLPTDRGLADPEVVEVQPASRLRLRIINGGIATAFWIDPGK